ncbi:MAG: PAS domain S-box protein [Chitinophagaceae bacterium]
MKKFDRTTTIAGTNNSGRKKDSIAIKTSGTGKNENHTTASSSKDNAAITSPDLTLLLNNTEESFLLIDTQLTVILFNKRFHDLYKEYFGKDIAKGDSILDYAQTGRREIVREIYTRALAGETIESEIEVPHPDQSIRIFVNKFKPVRDENNTITGVFVNIADVTETKKAEKLFRQERMLLRALIDNLPINVYTKDLQSRKTLANKMDYEYAGFSSEQGILGKDDSELFSEESAKNTIEEDKYIFTTGKSIIGKEEHHIKKDGSDIWFLISKIPLKKENNEIAGLVGISYDITERKLMEEQIQKNEADLQKAFDIAAIGSWKYDIKNDRYEWSRSAVDVIGYKEKDIPHNWESYKKFLPEEDILSLAWEIENSHRFGVLDIEHRINIYGKTKWVRERAHIEYDENKTPIASIGIIQDITERKFIEQQLKDAYSFNQTIIDTSPVGIWIYDESGQTISTNRAAVTISGTTMDELLQLNFKNIPLWKQSGMYDAAIEALQSGKTVKKEIHFINSYNKEVWLDSFLTAVQFKGKKHLILMAYDILDRMKAEESLKDHERQLSIAMRIARLAYWEFDVVEGLFTFNDQFYAMLNTTVEEVGGYTLTPEKYAGLFVYPEDQALIGAEVGLAITTTDPNFSRQIEHRVIFGNGETGYVSVNFYIIKDDKGNTIKTYGVNQDITERKKYEVAIEELNIQLSKRALELTASNTELERFAYVASHDLQEPLRMVSSFLQLLQKKYNNQLDETANQYISYAVDGSDRMKRLIMDLLEYSRVGTNRDTLVDTNMNEVVNQVLGTFTSKIQETDASIKVQSMPVVKANKTQMLQLVQNLVGNAFKYNASPVPAISIGCEEKEDAWEFFVKDNGIGIDPKFFDKVFIIFQRLHNKNQFSGTGIGLAICKKIIEKHGGSIWIESAGADGSTFYFTIKK